MNCDCTKKWYDYISFQKWGGVDFTFVGGAVRALPVSIAEIDVRFAACPVRPRAPRKKTYVGPRKNIHVDTMVIIKKIQNMKYLHGL